MHAEPVPPPPWKLLDVGSQAMSPAAAITGSPGDGIVTDTAADRFERLPDESTASTA